MKEFKRIPINIWDDYYDDGYVPEGKKQETFIYVEDTDMSQEKHKESLEKILEYINKNLELDGVKSWIYFYDSRNKYPSLEEMYHFERWEIRIENLTHKRREQLVDELKGSNLYIDNIPFEVYSES